MWEECWRIETDQGRFFAKRFMRKDRLTTAMVRGLELSESLRLKGIPAPRIVKTRGDEMLATTADGERFLVTEWALGRTYRPGDLPPACVAPMGALLGRLHRLMGSAPVEPAPPLPAPAEGAERCRRLLERYEGRPEPFAAVARQVLSEQIRTLDSLPPDFGAGLPRFTLGGPVFNSYWAEQLLFAPDGSPSALVDWTDGAGKTGHWGGDIDCGIHLSCLDPMGTAVFMAAYQQENPLPEREWEAVRAELAYGHLASTNFLGSWFARPYRRMDGWEATAARWHRQIVPRFLAWLQEENVG